MVPFPLGGSQRQRLLVDELAVEQLDDLVHQRAAVERRDLLDQLRWVDRLQPQPAAEEVPLRTQRVLLDLGRRNRRARLQVELGTERRVGDHPVADAEALRRPPLLDRGQPRPQSWLPVEQRRDVRVGLGRRAQRPLDHAAVVLGLGQRPAPVRRDARRADALDEVQPLQLVGRDPASGEQLSGLQ